VGQLRVVDWDARFDHVNCELNRCYIYEGGTLRPTTGFFSLGAGTYVRPTLRASLTSPSAVQGLLRERLGPGRALVLIYEDGFDAFTGFQEVPTVRLVPEFSSGSFYVFRAARPYSEVQGTVMWDVDDFIWFNELKVNFNAYVYSAPFYAYIARAALARISSRTHAWVVSRREVVAEYDLEPGYYLLVNMKP
jgi:hypothetical protein